MRNAKGRIIAFEGIDGSGKTSLSKSLHNKLSSSGFKCSIFTPFSGSSSEYHKTLSRVKGAYIAQEEPLNKETEQTLYTFDFLIHTINSLPIALVDHDIILVDRYIIGRIALCRWDTGEANSIPEKMIVALMKAKQLLKPKISFLLKVSQKEASKRIVTRAKEISPDGSFEIEEKEKPQNLLKMINIFEEMQNSFGEYSEDSIILDGNKTISENTHRCFKEIVKIF